MRQTLILASFLLLPGTYWVQRLTNLWSVLAYLVLGGVCVALVSYLRQRWLHAALNERIANVTALLVYLLLIGAFLIIYPRVNCQVPNCGSDRDDALRLASAELLAGRYPYYPTTYHGNPLTPLPGAVMLALPFQLLGNAAYQTFFWLAAFFMLARNLLGSSRQAIVLCGLILLSPAVLHEILTGGDLFTNGLYVLVLGTLAGRTISAEHVSPALKMTLAVLFGIALSSRINFVLFAPLVLAHIYHQRGQQTAIRYGGLIIGTTLLVTLPFYLYDPANFAPLQRTSELADLDAVLPNLGSIYVPLLMIGGIGLASLRRFQQTAAQLLLNMGAVQLLPILIGSIAFSLASMSVDIQLMAFGPIFISFGALGTWSLDRNAVRKRA